MQIFQIFTEFAVYMPYVRFTDHLQCMYIHMYLPYLFNVYLHSVFTYLGLKNIQIVRCKTHHGLNNSRCTNFKKMFKIWQPNLFFRGFEVSDAEDENSAYSHQKYWIIVFLLRQNTSFNYAFCLIQFKKNGILSNGIYTLSMDLLFISVPNNHSTSDVRLHQRKRTTS